MKKNEGGVAKGDRGRERLIEEEETTERSRFLLSHALLARVIVATTAVCVCVFVFMSDTERESLFFFYYSKICSTVHIKGYYYSLGLFVIIFISYDEGSD